MRDTETGNVNQLYNSVRELTIVWCRKFLSHQLWTLAKCKSLCPFLKRLKKRRRRRQRQKLRLKRTKKTKKRKRRRKLRRSFPSQLNGLAPTTNQLLTPWAGHQHGIWIINSAKSSAVDLPKRLHLVLKQPGSINYTPTRNNLPFYPNRIISDQSQTTALRIPLSAERSSSCTMLT